MKVYPATILGSIASILADYWVRRRARRYRQGRMSAQLGPARSLTQSEQLIFGHYFSADLLDAVRIAEVSHIKPCGPLSSRWVKQLRLPAVFDLSHIRGMAYGDTIVVAGAPKAAPIGLIFHELVHVAQFRALGARPMLARYISDFLITRDYFRIAAEVQAYALQDRFDSGRGEPFDVQALIAAGSAISPKSTRPAACTNAANDRA